MHGKYTLPVITMNGKAYMCIYNRMPDVESQRTLTIYTSKTTS